MSLRIVSEDSAVTPLSRWQAIAWAVVKARPGSDFDTALQELYKCLSDADKLRCRAEIHACRKAMRGETEPEVIFGKREYDHATV